MTTEWEITPTFVEEKLIHEPVAELSVKAGSNVGDNVAGSLQAITVKTKSGRTFDLVFKTFPNDPEILPYVIGHKIFRIETAVYESLVPSLKELLIKAGQSLDVPLPKCYAAYNDDAKDFLCLEDLRPQGYRMLDKGPGLTDTETTAVLQELARFHALTYHLIRYEGEKYFSSGNGQVELLRERSRGQDESKFDEDAKFFGESVNLGIETISSKDQELGAKVRRTLGDNANAVKILMSTGLKTDELYFPVMVHGDLWTNNILFKHKPNGEINVKFIDFQQTHRGNIYEDLQYFFLTSTAPSTRRVHLHIWLNVYYSAFVKTLKSMGCPKPSRFTLGSFMDGMWDSFLSGYVYMHFAIPFQLGILTPFEGEVEEDPPQYGAQPPDTDQILAVQHQKFRKWMERSPAAKQRLLEITQEFVDTTKLPQPAGLSSSTSELTQASDLLPSTNELPVPTELFSSTEVFVPKKITSTVIPNNKAEEPEEARRKLRFSRELPRRARGTAFEKYDVDGVIKKTKNNFSAKQPPVVENSEGGNHDATVSDTEKEARKARKSKRKRSINQRNGAEVENDNASGERHRTGGDKNSDAGFVGAGKTDTIFDVKMGGLHICSLDVMIDPNFAFNFAFNQDAKYAVSRIIRLIRRANWASRSAPLHGGKLRESIGFKAVKIVVPPESLIDHVFDDRRFSNIHYWPSKIKPKIAMKKTGEMFDKYFPNSKACLQIAFVYNNLAPAYAISNRRSICTTANHALVSGYLHTHQIGPFDIFRGIMHVIGVAFGAGRDDTQKRSCNSDEFQYLNPYPLHPVQQINVGIRTHSRMMSPCGNEDISQFLTAHKPNCFVKQDEKSFCGNGIVEPGEWCDCGSHEKCQKSMTAYQRPCCGEGDSLMGCQKLGDPRRTDCTQPRRF